MWPREHGAYGQLMCPVVTALALAGIALPALLTIVAAAAAFLVHEPSMVLLGRRGERIRQQQQRRAARWLLATGVGIIVSGTSGVWLAPAHARWAYLLPLVPALAYAAAVTAKREKTAGAEIAAALTFSLLAVPLCLVAGASTATGLAVGLSFVVLSTVSTLGVRVVILKIRAGGNRRAVWMTRMSLLLLGASATAGLAAASLYAVFPVVMLVAVAPGLLVAVTLAVRPPAPTRLRAVGWALVSTSSMAMMILIAGLRAP